MRRHFQFGNVPPRCDTIQENGTIYTDKVLCEIQRADIDKLQATIEIYRRRMFDAGMSTTIDFDELLKELRAARKSNELDGK